MEKVTVRVSKCYLVQVLDGNGNEVDCNYTFSNRDGAIALGKWMKEEYLKRLEGEEIVYDEK